MDLQLADLEQLTLNSTWFKLHEALVDGSKSDTTGILADVAETVKLISKQPVDALYERTVSTPCVSVIVTAFNCEAVISSSITSLLLQSHQNIEVIVVDDCSTDDTWRVIQQFASSHSRIKAVKAAANAGTYVAKNVGLLYATGEFVTFQDSDDISHPSRIESQIEMLRKAPAAVATSCHYCRIGEDTGNLLMNRGESSRPGLISLMFRRELVLQRIGYFDSVRVNADDEFKNRLRAAFGKGALVESPACHYFALLREDGLTGSGHTGNNLDTTNMQLFLAPVRQRYTTSFISWHRSERNDDLYIDFPGGRRPFVSPSSIDALRTRRFDTISLVLNRADPGVALDSALLEFFHEILVIRGEASDEFTRLDLSENHSSDYVWKEVCDHSAASGVIYVEDTTTANALELRQIRYELYLMTMSRPSIVTTVLLEGRAAFIPFAVMDVAGVKFNSNGNRLLEAILKATLRMGGQIKFA